MFNITKKMPHWMIITNKELVSIKCFLKLVHKLMQMLWMGSHLHRCNYCVIVSTSAEDWADVGRRVEDLPWKTAVDSHRGESLLIKPICQAGHTADHRRCCSAVKLVCPQPRMWCEPTGQAHVTWSQMLILWHCCHTDPERRATDHQQLWSISSLASTIDVLQGI